MQLNSSSTRFANTVDATTIPMHWSSNGHYDRLLSGTVLNHQKLGIAQILMRAFVIKKNFISFKREHSGVGSSVSDDKGHEQLVSLEGILDQVNEVYTNPLQDNILYYIAGYVVKALLKEESCQECKTELLDESSDTVSNTPCSKFQKVKERGGLKHASPAVFKIVKAAEREFREHVIECEERITFDKNIDLKMQSVVLARLGIDVFNVSPQHYFDHRIGQETDHLSSLLKRVVSKYIQMRLKTYGKKYTAERAHGNKVSKRHQLTKLILFSNE